MRKFLLKYSAKISFGLLITIFTLSVFESMSFKIWGVYLILNGLLSFGLFIINGNPLWVGFGGFNYGMEKLLKKGYNRYLNLMLSIMSFVLGFGIIFMK